MSPRLWTRLRRWWTQDRIRLSAADLRPDRPRPGDRLQVGRRHFRLESTRDGHSFQALDLDRQEPLTVVHTDDGYRFEVPGRAPKTVPSEVVLRFPVDP